MPLLTLLPIFGYAFTFHLNYKKSISVSLFFSITFILSTLFVFGSFNFLQIGAHMLFFVGLSLLIYNLYKQNRQLKKTISSPPFIIYSSLSVLAFFAFKDMGLFFWDEYSHWGPFIKNMYYFNHFQTSSDIGAHLFYPPGAAVWNYFTLLYSPYQEGYLFFSYFLLLFSATIMMYENIPWERWYWLASVFILQLVIFSLFGHWFTSIYVDHLIGALFTGIILSYLNEKFKTSELLFFIFPLLSIFVIKEVGLYFAFSAVALCALLTLFLSQEKSFLKKMNSNKNRLALFASFLCFLFLFQNYWEHLQKSKGISSGKESITGIVSDLFTGKRELPEADLKLVKENFWKVFFSQQLHKEKISLTFNESSVNILPRFEKSFKITTFGFLFFFGLLVIIAHQLTLSKEKQKQIRIIGSFLFLVYGVYLSILFMSYLIAFGGKATRIPAYVRYVNMATLPLTFIAFSLFLPFFQRRKEKEDKLNHQYLVRAHALAILALVLITRPYLKPLYSQDLPPSRQNIQMITKKITEQLTPKSRLLVVMPQIKDSLFDQIIRYHLLPARSFVSPRNFLAKSSEEMQEIYSEYDHIWFPQLSKGVIRKNRQVLQQTLDGKVFGLYKVERATNAYKAIL